jgi:hypothetical protein
VRESGATMAAAVAPPATSIPTTLPAHHSHTTPKRHSTTTESAPLHAGRAQRIPLTIGITETDLLSASRSVSAMWVALDIALVDDTSCCARCVS